MSQDTEELDSQNQETEEVLNTEAVEETDAQSDTEDQPKFTESEMKSYARMKKAEAEVQRLKKELANKTEAKIEEKPSINTPSIDPDELRLIARGLSDGEIEQLRVIAKGKGLSLTESTTDPLFIAYQEQVAKEEKKAKAKLGASKGSSQAEDSGLKPGMTEEEHKEVWKKMMG